MTLFLIGSVNTISEDLRPYATSIIDLGDLADQIGRPRPMALPSTL